MNTILKYAVKIDRKIKKELRKLISYNRSKIFCISLQRTGTTSTGRFFKDHGYSVATYGVSSQNGWTISYFNGNYEKIFKSSDFKKAQAFEDDPWWVGDFYKVLFHRFPDSKFILLERDANNWFDSMVSHSKGRTLGITHIHCTIYQRLKEFYDFTSGEGIYTDKIDNALPLGEAQREHYTDFYTIRNREVKLFFQHHNRNRLFTAQLEDEDLWWKMGRFFGVDVDPMYRVHLNKTQK